MSAPERTPETCPVLLDLWMAYLSHWQNLSKNAHTWFQHIYLIFTKLSAHSERDWIETTRLSDRRTTNTGATMLAPSTTWNVSGSNSHSVPTVESLLVRLVMQLIISWWEGWSSFSFPGHMITLHSHDGKNSWNDLGMFQMLPSSNQRMDCSFDNWDGHESNNNHDCILCTFVISDLDIHWL